MRTYHVVAVFLVLLIAVGVKQIIYPPLKADAGTAVTTMDVLSMHTAAAYKPMKSQRIHDMESVFADGD